MNLLEYIRGLIAFGEENPDALRLPVITAKDDEGNGYQKVHFAPSKGFAGDIGDYSIEDFSTTGSDPGRWEEGAEPKPNAVCVN